MFRVFLTSLFLFSILNISSVEAQTATPNGNVLGFGSGVTAAELPPTSGETLSYDTTNFDPNYDPLTDTSNLSMGEPVPGTSGGTSGGASGGGSPKGAATQEEIQEAVQAYVIPTSTRFFSLSNLNSDREASLVISSGNEENNVIFRVIRLIAMLVGTVAIILYIVAGYYMIFSRGEENELTKGKQIITFTSLGLVIAFGAYMIVQLVMGLIYFSS